MKALKSLFLILLLICIGCSKTLDKKENKSAINNTNEKIDVDKVNAKDMEEVSSQNSRLTGETAPDFKLLNQENKPVSLKGYRGQWVILYFYPRNDTPGCACQATDFTKLIKDFAEINTKVIGISPDSVISHQVFTARYELKITLLSDPEGKVMQKYGAWNIVNFGSKKIGQVIRTTFLINPKGKVAYHWPEVIAKGHAERVKNILDKIIK